MLELLEQLFRQVRFYAQSERFDRSSVYAKSSKHTTMKFDRDAEDIIIRGLEESGHGFEVISEERPAAFSTQQNPAYRIIIDPIDGSENVTRGIMTAGVSLAVLPITEAVTPDRVLWALVGELFSGTVYVAQHGDGAFRNGRRCQVSTTKGIQSSMISLNMDDRNQKAINALVAEEPHMARVRRTGSAATDSVYVASGTYDAYIDIGGALTGESFLAAASIVLEAGGIVTDQEGKALRPITNLQEKYSVVMAATQELHEEIINRIKQ